MKILRLTLAFVVLAAAACAAQDIQFSSTPYAAPAFYANFPAPDNDKVTVQYSSDEITLKNGGTTTLHDYALSLHDDQDAFLVLYCDIPNTHGDTAALDAMLDGALAKLDNAKPGPKFDTTYSGIPARMVIATGTYSRGQTTFYVTSYHRIAVQGNRVWQGIVICDHRTSCTETDANKFLNSIKIR